MISHPPKQQARYNAVHTYINININIYIYLFFKVYIYIYINNPYKIQVSNGFHPPKNDSTNQGFQVRVAGIDVRIFILRTTVETSWNT